MSRHDKSDQNDISGKGQSKRIGVSVLLAAVSLLGTSLRVSAVTSDEPPGPAASTGSAGQNAVETNPGKKMYLQVADKSSPTIYRGVQGKIKWTSQPAPKPMVRPPSPPAPRIK